MVDFNGLLILVFVFLTSCQAQSGRYPPTNLRAVYSATDDTIRVTWDPPSPSTTNIDAYYVMVNDTGGHVRADRRVYLYNNTKPNTEYPIKVTTIKDRTVGSSSTTIITLPTTYRQRGTRTRQKLPKPPGGISHIAFNGQILFTLLDDGIIEDKTNTTMISVTVSVTSTDTELEITTLTTQYAGYYYIMMSSGNEILGGKLLVVTDTPTPPTIIPENSSPVVDTAVTLRCSSSSRSKPDNHGLVLTASWKLNGTVISHARFSVSGTGLTIHQVQKRDKFNVYTCVTTETGQGVSLSSEESQGFKLTPRYGPQFVRIEGTDGKSPVIRGDVYGPVVCRTDCNPPCSMEWRRQGITFIQSNTASNNSLVLEDNSLPRIREVNYTCLAGVPSTAGFTAPIKEKNLNIEVHFPPNITELRYRDGVDNPYKRIGSGDVRYTEGSSLELRVVVDSSPPADVTLSRDQTTVAGSTTGNYDIKLDDLQCDHTGRYEVRAANYVTRNRSNISPSGRQFGLQVSCVPRRQDGGNGVIGVLGRKLQTVPLNVTVIANPQPIGRWSGSVRPLNVLPINAYMYTFSGQVTINTQSDFRDYHVNIGNSVPGSLTVSFQIRGEGVPDKPEDFHASKVSSSYAKVMWTSGYNGGSPQLFHIDIMTAGKEWSPVSLNISDAGQGSMMTYTILDLTPDTDYVIRLNVSNRLGKGSSTEIRVRTLGVPDKPRDFHASKVSSSYAKVMWTSGYNGGSPQLFHIDIMTARKEWSPVSLNISDAGQGSMMTYTILDLTPDTDYVIRLNVSNRLGKGSSTEIRVRTLAISQKPNAELYLTGLVISVVNLVLIVVIAIFVIKRKRRQKERAAANVSRNSPDKTRTLELQSRSNARGRRDEVNTEQENAYASADEEPPAIPTIRKLQTDRGAAQNEVNEYQNTAIGPLGGASQNEINAYQNTEIGPPGGSLSADDTSNYTKIEPPRGQEHVYDTTNPEHQGRGAFGGSHSGAKRERK